MADPTGYVLPQWLDAATTGNVVPTLPPVFKLRDLEWNPPTPESYFEQESGNRIPVPGQPGFWTIKLYGVPAANVPFFATDDAGTLYRIGGRENDPPASFVFGIKSGRDQGYLYRYELQPDGSYVPTGTSGLIGGRNGVFDTNAFIRESNKMAAIIVVAIAGGAYLALAAEGAAAGAGAGAAAEGGAGAGYTAADLAAADAGAGLLPAYGSAGAYDAAIAAGGASAADLAAADAAAGLIPGGGGGTVAETAAGAATQAGGASSAGWGKLVDAAINQAGKFASSALVSQIAKQTQPGRTPAQSTGASGTVTLPDGSTARVNPDGSITVLAPGGQSGQVIGTGGQVAQWVPGVPNLTLFLVLFGIGATLLRGLR